MSLSINTNVGSEHAAVAAKKAAAMMNEAMVRLSTGKRINSAKDDAAGIQVAIRIEAELNGLTQALRNANNAQATVDTAEGALGEVHTLLLRMREIAVSASSDTNSDADRLSLDTEVTALETEIKRIATSTTWGGQVLLNGAFSKGSPMVFHLGPKRTDNISVTLGIIDTTAVHAQGSLSLSSNVTTLTNAGNYISTIDRAISIVSTRRGVMGAVSNRLSSSIANINNMKANLTAAKGGVVDADFAEETAKLARAQILMQAATAMLAQANASKQQTLQLLNG